MINYNINKELFNPSKINQNNKLSFDDISVNDVRVDAIRTYNLDVDFGEYSNTPISTNIIFITTVNNINGINFIKLFIALFIFIFDIIIKLIFINKIKVNKI